MRKGIRIQEFVKALRIHLEIKLKDMITAMEAKIEKIMGIFRSMFKAKFKKVSWTNTWRLLENCINKYKNNWKVKYIKNTGSRMMTLMLGAKFSDFCYLNMLISGLFKTNPAECLTNQEI